MLTQLILQHFPRFEKTGCAKCFYHIPVEWVRGGIYCKQGAIYIRSLIPLPDDDYDDSSETENEVGSVYLQCQVYFLIHLQVQVIVYIIQVYCTMYV